jgi:site-specific recombinase XerD
MEEFRKYLLSKRYKNSTVDDATRTVERFIVWKKKNRLRKSGYDEVMDFLNAKKRTPSGKMGLLFYLRKYFSYQISIGERKDNPAQGINIRKTHRPVQKPLTPKEQDEIFEVYRNKTFTYQREVRSHNRFFCVLGLVMYQAITAEELKRLRKQDIDLSEGTIVIPGTEESNQRKLKLEARQIIPLMEYIKECQDKIIEVRVNDLLAAIIKHLKKLGFRGITIKRLRESRIVSWLREYNIRRVQYMSGLKYLSSLQRYKNQDIEGLKEKVMEFHPLR